MAQRRQPVPQPQDVYALYVEQELIGKRIKKSKIKIVWRFAFEDLVPHVIELKHSLVTGKREIKKDGVQEYQFRNVFSGKFVYPVTIRTADKSHLLRVMIEEHIDGVCKYDLEIDGCVFHRLRRKSAQELSDLRTEREAEAAKVTKLEYNSFVRSASSKALDGDLEADKKKEKKKKKKKKKEAEAAAAVAAAGAGAGATAAAASEGGWDAFDGSSAAPATTPGFDPFADPAPAAGTPQAFNPFGDDPPPAAAAYAAPGVGGYPNVTPVAAQQPPPIAAQPLTSSLAGLDFTTSFEKPSAAELATAAENEEEEDDLLGGGMMGSGGQQQASNNPFGDGVESLLVNLDNINLAPTSVNSTAGAYTAPALGPTGAYGRATGPAGAQGGYGGGGSMYPPTGQQQQQQPGGMGNMPQMGMPMAPMGGGGGGGMQQQNNMYNNPQQQQQQPGMYGQQMHGYQHQQQPPQQQMPYGQQQQQHQQQPPTQQSGQYGMPNGGYNNNNNNNNGMQQQQQPMEQQQSFVQRQEQNQKAFNPFG